MSCIDEIINIYSNDTLKSEIILRRKCVQTNNNNYNNNSVNIKSSNNILNKNGGYKNNNDYNKNNDNTMRQNKVTNAIIISKNIKVSIMLILFSVLVCLILIKKVDFENRLLSLDPISNASMGNFDSIINNQDQSFEFLECCKVNKGKMFDELIGPFEWDPAPLEPFNKETLMAVACMVILSCYLIL